MTDYKITDLNLNGFSSEYINVLRENDPDDDNLYEFPFSRETIQDFNDRIVTKDNYKDLMDMYNFLMMDDENSKKLAMEIAKLDFDNIYKVKGFKVFYGRFVYNKFDSNEELKEAINLYCENKEECEEKYGFVELWDVSGVTDMSCIFYYSQFNGDISRWDVSNVINMSCMFRYSQFNGDISGWDVSNVTNMYGMFSDSKFNGDISCWDVSSVTDMQYMFSNSQFNTDISGWNVSNVTNMYYMFYSSKFNIDISGWNVSNVTIIDWIY